MNFTLRDTSTHYLVKAMLEKIRIFSIVMSYFLEEPIFFLYRLVKRNLSNGKVVHNVSKPRERSM